ncbi:PH domain-containing protein [Flavobacterium sp.]|uniref:PH domain-containing protein n=1 Tax=Flavobacterium sp. TaxID=239 RepID=UPI0026169064|nr:PH domain-containing protein [Flavobacterium sp.]
MTVFNSAKNIYTLAILWVLVIMLPVPFIYATLFSEEAIEIVPLIVILLIEVFFLSMLLDTKYIVDGNLLHYRSGPIRGKIDILKIRKIEENNSFIKTSTLKPGLSNKGFTIHYNAYDDIFISPERKEDFVKTLVAINPQIEVC